MRPARLVALLVVAALSAPSLAQEPPAPPAVPPAPAANAAVREAWASRDAALRGMEAARASRDPAKIEAQSRAIQEAHARFVEAFRATDWDALDAKKDADLLGRGLLSLVTEAMQARRDGKEALRLCEVFVAKLAGTDGARQVALAVLPGAALMAGDVKRAEAAWEEAAAGADAGLRVNALMNLGDLRSAQGDLAAARKAWRTVVEAADQAMHAAGTGGRADPAPIHAKPAAEQRLALVGEPVPAVAAKTWVGGEAKPLAELAGSVVVLDLTATWCRPCLAVVPRHEALHRELGGKGVVVLGVTSPSPQGLVPRAGAKDPVNETDEVRDLTPETFAAHVELWRKRLGATYPVAIATEAEVRAFRPRKLPTAVVVDRAGRVAFVTDNLGDDTMLRLAVTRLSK